MHPAEPSEQQFQPCRECGAAMEFKAGYTCCGDDDCHANEPDGWLCPACFSQEDA